MLLKQVVHTVGHPLHLIRRDACFRDFLQNLVKRNQIAVHRLRIQFFRHASLIGTQIPLLYQTILY